MSQSEDKTYQNIIAALTHATRALSGQEDIDVTFEGAERTDVESKNNAIIKLPPLPRDVDKPTLQRLQARANRAAFLVRYGDDVALEGKHSTQIIKPLEEARTEALGRQAYRGSAPGLESLRQDGAHALLGEAADKQTPSFKGQVLGVALRQALGEELLCAEKDLLKENKKLLTSDIKNWLEAAAKHLNNPQERPKLYNDLIDILGLEEDNEEPPTHADDSSGQSEKPEEETGGSNKGEDQTQEKTGVEEGEGESQQSEATADDDSTNKPDQQGRHAKQSGRPDYGDGRNPYHIFTTAHDAVAQAEKLVSEPELARLRARFKKVTLGTQATVSQMAIKLQRLLMAQTSTGWRFDQEEGLLDPKKLPQIISSGDPYPFRRPRVRPERDTVVTLLLDNSGSMRGRPIEMAAVSADVLTRTLERCGVRTEVLGFTTQTWKGGQSRLDWISAGSPENPGRLNDNLNIIYKDADKSYQASRHAFAAMLADDLLKENIDGESLLWAYGRLLKRPEKRKILMVISDGAPVDYATDKHNPANFLDGHLRQVVNQIEKQTKVDLLTIGIGHDVGRYYRHAVTIQTPAQLSSALVERMVYLFSYHERTPKKLKT